ncbi:hypothetical protein [Yoonia vestfoldensis]|uniref:hypothetical protein n=1 Tax=Yoonia vestfoldensis TaxID=245188 RepID=UPI00035F607F|nr:hypothetical protein [Yoonia vestfoldensis]
MSGYFDKLIQSYGPAADTPPAQMPWMAEVAAPPDLTPDGTLAPAPAQIAPKVTAIPEQNPPPVQPSLVAAPVPQPDDRVLPAAPSLATSPATITPAEVSEPDTAGTEATPLDVPDATNLAVQVIHQQDLHETHLHHTETHLHHHDHPSRIVAVADPAPDDPTSPQRPDKDTADPPQDDMTTALAALETHLARTLAGLHGPTPHPVAPVITPADFEPDGSQLPPPAETETIREVTREVVREIHHHHETRIAPPPRPAPQSAQDASRIGPIRFASVWNSGGHAG